MVTLTLPVLLMATDCVPLLPTVTLPKLIVVGFAANCATGAAAPVPVSARLVGELEAVLTNETLPFAVPVAEGAKFTVNEVLAPAATVIGKLIPLML